MGAVWRKILSRSICNIPLIISKLHFQELKRRCESLNCALIACQYTSTPFLRRYEQDFLLNIEQNNNGWSKIMSTFFAANSTRYIPEKDPWRSWSFYLIIASKLSPRKMQFGFREWTERRFLVAVPGIPTSSTMTIQKFSSGRF